MNKRDQVISDLLEFASRPKVKILPELERTTLVPLYRDVSTGRITLKPRGHLLGKESVLPEDRTVLVKIYDTLAQAVAARMTVEGLGVSYRCEAEPLRNGEACVLIEVARRGSAVEIEDLRPERQRVFPASLSTDWAFSDVCRYIDAGLDDCADPFWRGRRIAQLCANAASNSVVLASCQSALEGIPGARITIDAISAEMVHEEMEDFIAEHEDQEFELPSLFRVHFYLSALISRGGARGMTHEEIVEAAIRDLILCPK